MKLKFALVVFSIFLISACANEPTTITLKPTLMNKLGVVYDQQAVKVSVSDTRSTIHIVELLSSDEPTKLIGTTSPLTEVLNDKFTTELTSQGLTPVEESDIKIEFFVKRARTYVNQDVLDYRANTIIKILVKVENPAQTLSKTFTLRATSRGPLKANMDELEKDFNLQLSKLILQVLEDKQLQSFILN